MAVKILVMGVPNAGKTYFSEKLKQELEGVKVKVDWFNSDLIREQYLFDALQTKKAYFNYENNNNMETMRLRKAARMLNLANSSLADFVICDFVCPIPAMHKLFDPKWTIWMDTIDLDKFQKTTKNFFNPPTKYNFRIVEKKAHVWAPIIAEHILQNNDTKLLLGKYYGSKNISNGFTRIR